MFANEDAGHVTGLVPSGLSRHVIRYDRPVDAEVLEADIFYHAVTVVTDDVGQFSVVTVVCDVFEYYVLDASSRCFAVFLIIKNA